MAADAFAAFQEAGLDEPTAVLHTGVRFADTVLGLGGSVPAAQVFRAFRGRDPSVQPLLQQYGFVVAAAQAHKSSPHTPTVTDSEASSNGLSAVTSGSNV